MSLLGGILKGVGGFITGGPAGAIAGVASELFKPRQTPATPAMPRLNPAINVASVGTLPILRQAAPLPAQFPQPDSTVVRPGVSIGGPRGINLGGSSTTYYPTAAPAGAPQGQNGGCPAGYHWNRTGYYTKRGYVAKGTACVKNRRRNPLNPRALSRSLSRIVSAKKAATFLDRVDVKRSCRPRR